jgi:hypothetical protein
MRYVVGFPKWKGGRLMRLFDVYLFDEQMRAALDAGASAIG